MKTSRSSLDRLLDPDNGSVTLLTLESVALALGKKLKVQISGLSSDEILKAHPCTLGDIRSNCDSLDQAEYQCISAAHTKGSVRFDPEQVGMGDEDAHGPQLQFLEHSLQQPLRVPWVIGDDQRSTLRCDLWIDPVLFSSIKECP